VHVQGHQHIASLSQLNVRFFGAYGPYEPLRKITTRFLTAIRRGDRQFTLRGDGTFDV